jgi:predicted lipoprotein with Yx(FWY)xxD motif
MIKSKSTGRVSKDSQSHMHHLHGWLFGLAVLTVLAVGVPVMLWAQSSEMTNRVSVDAGAMNHLQMKIGEMQQAMDMLLKSSQDMGGTGIAMVTRPDDARADCLNQCRDQQVSCLDGFPGEAAPGILHPCLAGTSECVTACNDAPRAPVSCQDRCAVALGGCVERVVSPKALAVEDEEAALDDCRMKNVECLMNACDLPDEAAMPDSYCADQCRRVHIICSTGSSQYDMNTMELCSRLEQGCKQRLCARVGLLPNIKIKDDKYLANQMGMALYTYKKDAKGESECEGTCIDNWPVFYVDELLVETGLLKEDFASMMRKDGLKQTTYKGWPLYLYTGDELTGDVKGNMKDDMWYLADPGMEGLTRAMCEATCDSDYEECKRSDEMPYACQQRMESCRITCFDLSTN